MDYTYGDNGSPKDCLEPLPARMLNEFVYCPRLFYLEWLEGDFQDSSETIEGRMTHRRVDVESGDLPPSDSLRENENLQIHSRSVTLSGERCGVISKIDLIEGSGIKVRPVEYKRGNEPEVPGGVWPSDLVQIGVQVLILRENGYDCDGGVVYYSGSRRRVNVEVSEDISRWVLDEVDKARAVCVSGRIPSPLVDSPKCVRCSLVSVCLPDEINSLILGDESEVDTEIRRLYPARDDSVPVYVQEQGSTVSKKNEEIVVKFDGKVISTARLMETSQLALFGNVQVTTQTINELCRRNIPISYYSTGGWFNGITHGMSHKNVEMRVRQYSACIDRERSLLLARKLIEGKIKNTRTFLRRNTRVQSDKALVELKSWADKASKAHDQESLLGIEGSAGRVYFQHFANMLKEVEGEYNFDFNGRNRRPARDPINAMLSFAYALLTKETTVTLLAVGFDPYLGFFHRIRYGKPALALDMMEEFRPLIGDSIVVTMINNGEITKKDFVQRGNSTSLTSEGRKKFIGAYERRMDSLITHPIFEYKLSYRRVLEVQSRLLARWLSGELKEYPPFVTR
ncbi:MAG: CRISPR-associated endonuclease Cas1 [Thermoplasmatales archaeon]|nr:CRISPR-associated endonuclease Cas1 [Thermoplasmatales archaeon]